MRLTVLNSDGPKRSKYGSRKASWGERTYDSSKEAGYAQTLALMRHASDPKQRAVEIEEQVRFPIVINGIECFSYILDFRVTYADGHIEHIDVKGYRGGPAYAMFRLKKKCVEAQYGIEIKEM